ncbi:unnamed protein product [Rotaria sordida]|uniref:Uncharacterized protein n=1 Tax=Rotaria sordida TaxID=392033 RepID=A0A814VVM7_9BILA|nr:unnamed protein product [Rotaria sordida]CAF1190577.1 unnamed protein product [Rotaria sordida]CAF4057747.1 unnamed protein product [Rotaria sordida]
MEAHIPLGTDDDGIWPINQCSSVHPGHQSLAAEYCRAISTSLINTKEEFERTFKTMKALCFWDMKYEIQRSFIENANSDTSPCMDTVIVHPDIIRRILERYKLVLPKEKINPAFDKFKIYPGKDKERRSVERQGDLQWTNERSKLRVAFVCICANQETDNRETLRKEYRQLFEDFGTSTSDFDFIYDSWQHILSDFAQCKSNNKPEITVEQQSKNKRKRYAIYSGESQSDEPLKFLENICWLDGEINIRAYATKMDVNRIKDAFYSQISNATGAESDKGTLYLFTNTHKYTYAYSKLDEKITFRLNPAPSKRELTDENFLYVLCHHAGAATAAVYLISEQLAINVSDSSMGSLPRLVASVVTPVNLEKTVYHTTTETTPTTVMESVPEQFTAKYANEPQSIDTNDNNRKPTHPCDDNNDENECNRRNMPE